MDLSNLGEQVSTVTESLPFPLSDSEKLMKGNILIDIRQQQETLKQQLSDLKKQINKELHELVKLEDNIYSILRSGIENREVECQKMVDYPNDVVRYYYQGKEVYRRDLNDDEAQLMIPMEDQ